MRLWVTDFAVSLVEALLEIVDTFSLVRPRTYLTVALVVVAVTSFAAWGPQL